MSMRVLLVHPEDSPVLGPWAAQQWDLAVDLGQSTSFSQRRWSEVLRSPVLSPAYPPSDSGDTSGLREIFSAGRGYLVDDEGIDYWDLISLPFVHEALVAQDMQRLVSELPASGEFWCTRADWPVSALLALLSRPCTSFDAGLLERAKAGARHYACVFQNFSPAQIKQIAFDKFDGDYKWRLHFARKEKPCRDRVVLIPSAYENVSRVAVDYAALVPEQEFLLVSTRRSGTHFAPRPNVTLRHLASYAERNRSRRDAGPLLLRWQELKKKLQATDLLRVLFQTSVFDTFDGWIRNSIAARNAWQAVFRDEPVGGVLCGDDTNPYTRLPVLLAARRKVTTLDFHHGALDGRYLFKHLPSDLYLAKNEMERDYLVRLCGLPAEKVVTFIPNAISTSTSPALRKGGQGSSLVLFSEPYEVAGLRVEEVYRELLPNLWRVAQENGRNLVVKLHPFESLSQRRRVIHHVLPGEIANRTKLVDGPMMPELLESAWCGVTIESTTVLECQRNGVCCFLCGWMRLSRFGYQQQYARFGIGAILRNREEILEIPCRIGEFHERPVTHQRSSDPGLLREWISGRICPHPELKPAS